MKKISFILFQIAFLALSLPTIATPTYEVLITEIFADPTPSRGLPEKEYIELFNNTQVSINLEGFTLQYNTSEVTFSNITLQPEQYLIVCRRGNGELYESYGDVLELSKFSLLNRGTTLTLLNAEGGLSHKVTYSDDWYNSERDQGYSLEMIDLDFPCTGKSNWNSTTAEIGGTPGLENSIKASNPDIAAPILLSQNVESDSVLLQFSEKLNTSIDIESFAIVEGINILEIKLLDDETALQLYFQEPLELDRIYTLTVEDLFDCSGNAFESTEIVLGNLPMPEVGEVVLTEVLFNPFPDGEDFIEIQNKGNKDINLRNLLAWNINNDGEPSSAVTLFSSDFLLSSEGVVCLTENKSQLIETYKEASSENIVQLNKLPSMNNSEGEILIGYDGFQVLDSMSYTEDDHSPFIDDAEGVSLFRNGVDWQSSSGSLGYATPGSIPQLGGESESLVTISPEIVTPNGDDVDDRLLITINAGSETVLVSGWVHDRYGNQASVIANNLYIGATGALEWAPTSNTFQAGYYYLYVNLSFSDRVVKRKIPFVIAYYN